MVITTKKAIQKTLLRLILFSATLHDTEADFVQSVRLTEEKCNSHLVSWDSFTACHLLFNFSSNLKSNSHVSPGNDKLFIHS